MKKLDRHWMITGLICAAVVGCGGDQPDLTVTATHKDKCIDGKPGVELLEAKIVNAGPGTVVLAGDDTRPWVVARPSLPLPNWATPNPTANRKTLAPGESVSIPIRVIAPPHPDNAGYNLIVEVDPRGAYEETDENNNQYLIPVSSGPCK